MPPATAAFGPTVPPRVATLADFVQWCDTNPKRATYGTAAAGSMLHFTGTILAKHTRSDRRPDRGIDLPSRHRASLRAVRRYPRTDHHQRRTEPAAAGGRDRPRSRISHTGSRGVVRCCCFGKDVGRHRQAPQRGERAAVGSDRFASGAAKLAVAPAADSPEQFAQLIKSDFNRWEPIVQASGFSSEDQADARKRELASNARSNPGPLFSGAAARLHQRRPDPSRMGMDERGVKSSRSRGAS